MEMDEPEFSVRITHGAFSQALRSQRPIPAGLSYPAPGHMMLLAASPASGRAGDGWVQVRQAEPANTDHLEDIALRHGTSPGVVWTVTDSGAGELVAVNASSGRILGVRLVGPGMEYVHGRVLDQSRAPAMPSLSAWLREGRVEAERESGTRSRLIGALGDNTVSRLGSMTVAVIGCGRLGSLMADALARLGCDLLLVDGDVIEPSNLDAMLAFPWEIGLNKAECLARRLESLAHTEPLPLMVEHPAAIRALRRADVVISAVDDDGARSLCALAASAWLQPHIDVATGMLAEGRERGADIRVTYPGEACLNCLGGLARPEGIDRIRLNQPAASEWWHGTRAGSLRSLNGIAAHFALRLFEELARGTLETSAWWHIEERLPHQFEAKATLQHEVDVRPQCPVCAIAGTGDRLLASLHDTLSLLVTPARP